MQLHTPAGAGVAFLAILLAFLLVPFVASFVATPNKG
jgi:hypothetical protein